MIDEQSFPSPAVGALDVDPDTWQRFWSKVDRSSGPDACWLWTSARVNGFGLFAWRRNGHSGSFYAHKLAYQFVVASLAPDETVTSTCKNRPCCNPTHLTVVNKREYQRQQAQERATEWRERRERERAQEHEQEHALKRRLDAMKQEDADKSEHAAVADEMFDEMFDETLFARQWSLTDDLVARYLDRLSMEQCEILVCIPPTPFALMEAVVFVFGRWLLFRREDDQWLAWWAGDWREISSAKVTRVVRLVIALRLALAKRLAMLSSDAERVLTHYETDTTNLVYITKLCEIFLHDRRLSPPLGPHDTQPWEDKLSPAMREELTQLRKKQSHNTAPTDDAEEPEDGDDESDENDSPHESANEEL